MPIDYEIDEPRGIVRLTWAGDVPISEWEQLMDRVQDDPRYQPGFVFLSDRTGSSRTPTVEEIKTSVRYFERNFKRLGRTTWAVLIAPSLADFGMMRMGQSLADEMIVMAYFQDADKALEWLEKTRRQPEP